MILLCIVAGVLRQKPKPPILGTDVGRYAKDSNREETEDYQVTSHR